MKETVVDSENSLGEFLINVGVLVNENLLIIEIKRARKMSFSIMNVI